MPLACRSTSVWTTFQLAVATMIAVCLGCSVNKKVDTDIVRPSNHRNWKPNLATLAYAEQNGDTITVRNIRNCNYITSDDYIVDYYDRTMQLSDVQCVDFIVVPFAAMPTLAHTMLSFGLKDGDYISVSVECRLEEDEKYSPLLGAMRQFEIQYVIADERDTIRVRTRHRDDDVFVYPTKATPQQAQELFVEVMERCNKLAREPEFYDTLTNNCTTNIADHVNKLNPNRVPYNLSVLMPGLSDRYAYELGLINTTLTFEQAREAARVNDLAEKYYDSPDFSRKIRRL